MWSIAATPNPHARTLRFYLLSCLALDFMCPPTYCTVGATVVPATGEAARAQRGAGCARGVSPSRHRACKLKSAYADGSCDDTIMEWASRPRTDLDHPGRWSDAPDLPYR